MISNVIDLTLALSKAGESAILVTKDDSVIETLKEHGKEIALKTGVSHLRVQKNDPEGVRKSYSVNYEGVEEKYGDKAVVIIGKVATMSYESIKRSSEGGALKIEVDGEEYEIEKGLLKEELVKPAGSRMIDFGKGYVFVEAEEEEDITPETLEENKEDVSEEHDN